MDVCTILPEITRCSPNIGCVTPADRSAVFEAVADIQRHGIFFSFQKHDIYITERGVRFADACSAKRYQDRDALAEEAEFMWKTLADIFNHMEDDRLRAGSRSMSSSAVIIPRLPSPSRPITLMPEEITIRWVWSTATSDEFCLSQGCAFTQLYMPHHSSEYSATRRGKRTKGDRRALLPPDDLTDERETSVTKVGAVDEPLVVHRISVTRYKPYARPASKRLLLPQEPGLVALTA